MDALGMCTLCTSTYVSTPAPTHTQVYTRMRGNLASAGSQVHQGTQGTHALPETTYRKRWAQHADRDGTKGAEHGD